jgi:hypothetical protein
MSAAAATNPALVEILTSQCASLNDMIKSTDNEISLHAEGQVEIPAAISKCVDLTSRKLPTGDSECSPMKATPKTGTKKLRGKGVLQARTWGNNSLMGTRAWTQWSGPTNKRNYAST